jgi:hypothetical protein
LGAITEKAVEYFDESENEEEDHTPIEEIEDSEGVAWMGDDGEVEFQAYTKKRKGMYVFALSIEEAQAAFSDLTLLLHPRQGQNI